MVAVILVGNPHNCQVWIWFCFECWRCKIAFLFQTKLVWGAEEGSGKKEQAITEAELQSHLSSLCWGLRVPVGVDGAGIKASVSSLRPGCTEAPAGASGTLWGWLVWTGRMELLEDSFLPSGPVNRLVQSAALKPSERQKNWRGCQLKAPAKVTAALAAAKPCQKTAWNLRYWSSPAFTYLPEHSQKVGRWIKLLKL